MPLKASLVAALLACFAAAAGAQVISGDVLDSLGAPVPYASVVASSCADGRVLGFAHTDAQGRFALQLRPPCDSVALVARCIGYRPAFARFPSDSLPAAVRFALAPAELEAVVVRGKAPPVSVRGDTTEYDLASFSDSTEVSVEDLLKKLPGVSVSENGAISYNGKPVERVLVEGDDLFGESYTVGTRNIRAEMLSKVQVIDRFQDNPLMKGIQHSDRTVLNLKIKPDRKRALAGNVEVGGGLGGGGKGLAHANAFSISRRDKLYLIGNANNTGRNALSEAEWSAAGGLQGQLRPQALQSSPLSARHPVPDAPLEDAGLPPAHTQPNRNGLLYAGWSLPGKSGEKTVISAWAGGARLGQSAGSGTRFLLGTEQFDVGEAKSAAKARTAYALQAVSSLLPDNPRHSLRSFVKVSRKGTESRLELLRSQTGAPDFPVSEQSGQLSDEWLASVEYTFKHRPGAAFQVAAKAAGQRGAYDLRAGYAWYAAYFGAPAEFGRLRQRAEQARGRATVSARWLGRAKGLNWSAEAGLDRADSRLAVGAGLEDGEGARFDLGPRFSHASAQRLSRLFAAPSVAWDRPPFLVRLRAPLHWGPASLRTAGGAALRAPQWAWEPRLDLRADVGRRSSVGGHYERRQSPPDLLDLRPGAVFAGYQSLGEGLPDLGLLPGHQAGAFFRYNHPRAQRSLYVNASASSKGREFGERFEISPFLTERGKFRPVSRRSLGALCGSEAYFPRVKLRLEAGLGAQLSEEAALVNGGAERRLSQGVYSAQLGGGTAFNFWANLVFTHRYAVSSGRAGAAGGGGARSEGHFTTAQLVLKPAKGLNMKVFVYRLSNRTGGYPPNTALASDASAYWQLPKLRASASLTAVNLLGARAYTQVFADALAQGSTRVDAVRPFFVVAWEQRF